MEYEKEYTSPPVKISQKLSVRLGALARVTSELKFKINEVVSKTVVMRLVGSLVMSTIFLSKHKVESKSCY